MREILMNSLRRFLYRTAYRKYYGIVEIGIVTDLFGVNPDNPQRLKDHFFEILHGIVIQNRGGDNFKIGIQPF